MTNGPSQNEIQIRTIIGDTVSEDRQRLREMEVRGEFAASKTELERLQGKINSNHQELQKFISDKVSDVSKEVSELEVKTLNQYIGSMTTLLAIAAPILAGVIFFLLDLFLSRGG